jgi:uncharacterized protein
MVALPDRHTILSDFNSLDLVQFDSGENHVLFSPETFQVFRLGKTAASIFHDVRKGSSMPELSQKYQLSEDKLAQVMGNICEEAKSASRVTAPLPKENFLGADLGKLVLMVNNYCNLKCAYCYEMNTVFSKKALDMPRLIVETSLDKFYASFRSIENLMFIGGEPTLSEAVLEIACAYAVRKAGEHGCPLPKFSMITNGARMTDRVFELIGQYQIQITFSLDGPRAVQDLVRIRHDDTGSYDSASQNMHRYSRMFREKMFIESTLTRAHKQANVTPSDLVDFFAGEFGLRSTHIVPAGLPNNDPLNPYADDDPYIERELQEAAAKSIENLFDEMMDSENPEGHSRGSLDSVGEMLRCLVTKDPAHTMCPAGTTQLVVDAFGDLYPCWMFAGQHQFKMGNILKDDIFNLESHKLLKRIHDNSKINNPQCSTCFARYVCHACIGNNQHSTGAIESIDERFCRTVRNSLQTVLLKIGEVRQDPERWGRLQAAIGKAREHQHKC